MKTTKKNIIKILSTYGIYAAFVILFIILSFASDAFFTITNLVNILRQAAVIGIISIGMTFVIITGGIDLSVGAIVAFSGVVATSFAVKDSSYPAFFAVGAGLLVGMACGVFSGFFTAIMDLPPFISTLATTTIARGLALVYTGGRPITSLSDAYVKIGKGSIGILPIPVVIFIVTAAIGIFFLNFTKFGRHVFAVGGNERAAIVSGINAKAIKFICYVISGSLSSLAAIVLSARIQTGQPAGGVGYETDAITAVVIGGTSMLGGVGTIIGSVVGMLFVSVMTNGLDLLNVSSYYQQVIKGVIIIIAVLSDRKKKS